MPDQLNAVPQEVALGGEKRVYAPTRNEYAETVEEQIEMGKKLKAEGYHEAGGTSVNSPMDIVENAKQYDVFNELIKKAREKGKKTVLVHAPYNTGTTLYIEQ